MMPDTCRLAKAVQRCLMQMEKDRHTIRDLLDVAARPDPGILLIRAELLLYVIKDIFCKLEPRERCSHPEMQPGTNRLYAASSLSKCSAHLIWDPEGRLRPMCQRHELIAAVQFRNLSWDALVVALEEKGCSTDPHEVEVEALLELLPLVFPPPKNIDEKDQNTDRQVFHDFARPMFGTAVDELQQYTLRANEHIGHNDGYDLVYAKTFPILQSSGTGKTKMVVQLSAFQAGLLVCTRTPKKSNDKQEPRGTRSFPPNDQVVYNFLRYTFPRFSSFKAHCRIAAWLGAYFNQLASELEQRIQQSGCFDSQGHPLHQDSRRCWSTIVYDFAVAIHSGPDFIHNYKFRNQDDPLPELCHLSELKPALPYDDGGRDTERTAPVVGDFRTHFLRAVAAQAHESLMSPSPSPSPTPSPSSQSRSAHSSPVQQRSQSRSQHPPFSRSRSRSLNSAETSPELESGSTPSNQHQHSQDVSMSPYDSESEHQIEPRPMSEDESEDGPEHDAQKAATRHMVTPLRRLEAVMPSSVYESHYFFLAIDEVRDLGELLPIFRRLWRESKPLRTWLMLIDTDSNVALLAGSEVVEASGRLGKVDGLIVLDPFSFLPFDVAFKSKGLPKLPDLMEDRVTFGELLGMLRWFGRPLWSTGLYYGQEGGVLFPEPNSILRKLLIYSERTCPWPTSSDPDTRRLETIMAAAAQRLPLRFVGMRGARHASRSAAGSTDTEAAAAAAAAQMEALDPIGQASAAFLQNQVSTHLRVISEVNGLNHFVTTTVSEPPLSMAVSSLLRGKGTNARQQCCARWSDVITILSKAYSTVGLLLGEEGEECARLLCSMAADLAAAGRVEAAYRKTHMPSGELDALRAQCDPVCLRDWLCELLDSDCLSSQLLSWSRNYYINFTHYMALTERVVPGEMNPTILLEGWWRQVAFYGNVNQPGWDLLIPVYHSDHAPDLSDIFLPSQLSYVAIQVKNRMTDVTAIKEFGPTYKCNADGATSPNGWLIRDDCLEIFIDLRSPAQKQHACLINQKRSYPSSEHTPRQYYHIIVSGWSARVFGVVKQMTDDARREMWRLFDLTDSKGEENARQLRAHASTKGIKDTIRFYKNGGLLHTCYNLKEKSGERSVTRPAELPKSAVKSPRQSSGKAARKVRKGEESAMDGTASDDRPATKARTDQRHDDRITSSTHTSVGPSRDKKSTHRGDRSPPK